MHVVDRAGNDLEPLDERRAAVARDRRPVLRGETEPISWETVREDALEKVLG
jgi:hypothetical protein